MSYRCQVARLPYAQSRQLAHWLALFLALRRLTSSCFVFPLSGLPSHELAVIISTYPKGFRPCILASPATIVHPPSSSTGDPSRRWYKFARCRPGRTHHRSSTTSLTSLRLTATTWALLPWIIVVCAPVRRPLTTRCSQIAVPLAFLAVPVRVLLFDRLSIPQPRTRNQRRVWTTSTPSPETSPFDRMPLSVPTDLVLAPARTPALARS